MAPVRNIKMSLRCSGQQAQKQHNQSCITVPILAQGKEKVNNEEL